MTTIQCGTAVALISERETMKGRVRNPPRHGKASVYWVNRLRASSVGLDRLVPIDDAELVAFLDDQERQKREMRSVFEGDQEWPAITLPVGVPQFVLAFIRTGEG